MPANNTEYMRQYRKKMGLEQPEKCRKNRLKKYAKNIYAFNASPVTSPRDLLQIDPGFLL